MIKNKHYLHNHCFKSVHPDQFFSQENKQKQFLEAGGLQVGHDALGDLQDTGVVGLPIRLGAVTRNAVPHRIQIRLREMGLH